MKEHNANEILCQDWMHVTRLTATVLLHVASQSPTCISLVGYTYGKLLCAYNHSVRRLLIVGIFIQLHGVSRQLLA